MRAGGTERLERTFVAAPPSARAARGFVAEAMTAAGVPLVAVRDAVLVISELASNIIEHGDGGSFAVVVGPRDARRWSVGVECALSAAGRQLPDHRAWSVASNDRRSGRGLGIVRTLSDEISVDIDHDRLAIECSLPVPLLP